MFLGKLFLTLFVGSAIATSTPVVAPADLPVKDLIVKYAREYGVDLEMSLAIAKCESGFNPVIFGDNGLAYGTYQFHFSTFVAFAKEMGEKMEYDSIVDNIKLANWAFANGKLRHWSCARILGYI